MYLETIKGLDSFGIKTKEFDYRLSKNLDTLFIKKPTDSVYGPSILRIKNAYDYYLKRLQLTIDLPSKNNLILSKEKGIGLDVYVGFRNGKLMAKTDSDKTRGLDEIKYETIAFIASQETELDSINFQFNLLIDKSLNNQKIDSIKNILISTGYKRIFRVYTNDQVDYEKIDWKDELNWYGNMNKNYCQHRIKKIANFSSTNVSCSFASF
ncbi:hypothetical protein GSB9_00004 [Flavobacteriaceae bacterium GSB9]|nr:hypothetical protein GSB9_00004 [Flavobacteriaceae bacterium GSB9]